MEPYLVDLPCGDCLSVSGGDGGVFLVATEGARQVRVFVPGEKFVDLSVALWQQAGQPVPVITPRPAIGTSGPLEVHGIRLSAEPDRVVRVVMGDGCLSRTIAPHAARALAGALVAYADAAESLPDPAEVDKLAMVLMEGNPTVMGLDGARPLARRILAALPALGYGKQARADGEETRSDEELHADCAHPGYQYATVNGPLGEWDPRGYPPAGDRWELNKTVGYDARRAFSEHQEAYWRRPRPAAGVPDA